MSTRLRLVVGLGNPGREYEGTRHNVGFSVLDRLAAKQGSSFRNKLRLAVAVATFEHPTGKVVLAKPQTYMNRSGLAVASLVHWLKVAPGEMLVVVDDADLPLGQLRLRLAGGSGGHNGLRSILEALGGAEGFPRLRVGIGRSGPVGEDITAHVLRRFSAAEAAAAGQALDAAVVAVSCCLDEGLTAAMNRFNRKATVEPDGPGACRTEKGEQS